MNLADRVTSYPAGQNAELDLAWQLVENTGVNVFLTGKAGTGKTTFLRQLYSRLPKRMIIVAPTGVAAINAGGVTIHSFFQLPLSPFVPDSTFRGASKSRFQFSRQKKNIIRSLDLLVIDEISMVRADLLDAIDDALRRYRDQNQPFGGVQLLMIGDLQQLAPVVKDDEWQLLREYYDTPYFFGSRALRQTRHVTIELQKVYRQTDQAFVDLLNKVRSNALTDADLAQFNSRVGCEQSLGDGTIRLTTHNRTADAYNENRLSRIASSSFVYRAKVEGTFPETSYPADALLTLKDGAQVMFLKNDVSGAHLFYNGMLGRVIDIGDDHITVRSLEDGHDVKVEPMEWTNAHYVIDKATREIKEEVEGTFCQYPLRLAWAITVHKSQGLTFERAVLDVNAAFAAGQVYVALSRCRTLQGLALTEPLSARSIIIDENVNRYVTSELAEAQTLPSQMEGLKRDYVRHLLDELFDYRTMMWGLQKVTRIVDEHLYKIYPKLLSRLKGEQPTIQSELFDVAPRFCAQMAQIIEREDKELLDERIHKACVYFEDKQLHLLGSLLTDCKSISSDNQRIQEQLEETMEGLFRSYNMKLSLFRSVLQNGFSVSSYLKQKARIVLDMEMGKTSSSNRKNLKSENGTTSRSAGRTARTKASDTSADRLHAMQNKNTMTAYGKTSSTAAARRSASSTALPKPKQTISRPAGSGDTSDDTSDVAYPELFNTLRRWRSAQAFKQHKNAYMVLSNATLIAIVNKLPTDAAGLLNISGLGPTKYAQYGDEILEIVRDYIAENAEW